MARAWRLSPRQDTRRAGLHGLPRQKQSSRLSSQGSLCGSTEGFKPQEHTDPTVRIILKDDRLLGGPFEGYTKVGTSGVTR